MGLPPATLCCGQVVFEADDGSGFWKCWKTLASTAWSSLSLLHRLEHSCIDLDRLSRPHAAATGLMLVFPLPPSSIHWLVITVPITLAKNWRYTSIPGSIPTSFNRLPKSLPREPWKPTAMDLAMFSQGAIHDSCCTERENTHTWISMDHQIRFLHTRRLWHDICTYLQLANIWVPPICA